MNADPMPIRGPVALVGLAPPDLEYAHDAAVLAGVTTCADPTDAVLTLAAPGTPVPAGVPCVRVGDAGQVSLPRDTALLVSLIAEASRLARRSGPTWVVAGIAGGVGVTSVVRLLARRPSWSGWARTSLFRRAAPTSPADAAPVLVDASGSVPGLAKARDHCVPGVRWADLDACEDSYLPSLRGQLPVLNGVACLVGDGRGGAQADDPRVEAACRSIDGPLIVDAGRWNSAAARCVRAIGAHALVLVTRGDLEGAAAMAAALSVAPPPCPAITLVAARRGRSRGLAHCAPTPILRAPRRPGKDLRALRQALSDASGTRDPAERSAPRLRRGETAHA